MTDGISVDVEAVVVGLVVGALLFEAASRWLDEAAEELVDDVTGGLL